MTVDHAKAPANFSIHTMYVSLKSTMVDDVLAVAEVVVGTGSPIIGILFVTSKVYDVNTLHF